MASRVQRLLVIGSLYLVANIGYSFFFLTLGTILLDGGASLQTVALINLLGGIYFGRFLVAPVVDRYGPRRLGHYRGWLLLTQLALVGLLLGLTTLDPIGDLPVLLVLLGLVLVVSVLHDTALNGFAVRLLRESDRGIGNGIIVGSGSASMLIGSGGALLGYAQIGWTGTVLALAAVFLLPLTVLARIAEPPAEQATGARRAAPWRAIAGYFRQPRAAIWTLVVIPLFAMSEWLATAPQPAMLLGAGWDVSQIAVTQSITTVVQLGAVIVTGLAISRYGRRRSGLVAGLLGTASVAGLLPLAAGHGPPLMTTIILTCVAIAYGAKLTWISTVSMDRARKSSASTDYTIPMSIEGIYVAVASSAGLGVAGLVGFGWLIAIAMGFAILGAILAPVWYRRNHIL
ncbi:MFS transporter [Tamaricihabitans halophyticus]|uniref:MFS transporter n=1 Tax=Tamaricihabitans halophyticus TaxID=1262583 RepID=A0A4R2QMC2_9PSEU|nr:MFS transporter [Tamaricihabitans halophyticus]TCP49994.1 MFS transporter [Tamaricihabitans halophyticus]